MNVLPLVFALLTGGPRSVRTSARPGGDGRPVTNAAHATRSTGDAAVAIVRRALSDMGGEARWRAVRTLELVGNATLWHIGDSEWLDAPLIADYSTTHIWRDVAGARSFAETTNAPQLESPEQESWMVAALAAGSGAIVVQNGQRRAVGPLLPSDSLDFLLAPERLLFTALAAGDLATRPDTVMRLVNHHVVAFHVGRTPVRIFFEAETGFPRMVETVRSFPNSVFFNAWGDVVERTRFTIMWREKEGIVYPRQIDVERGGHPYTSISYSHVGVNVPIPDSLFSLGDPAIRAAAPCSFGCLRADSLPLGVGGEAELGANGGRAIDVAPGVVQILAGWNVTLVRQADGVVVIEAPISAGYSARVIAEAARRFPGARIKAVITTTDFWWHVAGLREYIARGIPIYVLDRNLHVVRERAAARHTMDPDSLSRSPRAAIVRVVHARTVIGTGENRLEVIPFRTEGMDRMQMVYLPGRHLLYTAEAVQLYPSGLFLPQTAFEAVAAAGREGLTPDRFIGMHVPATPWGRLTAILDSLAGAASAP